MKTLTKQEAYAKRLEDIYAEAVCFTDGKNMTAKEIFEIMYESKEYTLYEITYIMNKLYADGFIK